MSFSYSNNAGNVGAAEPGSGLNDADVFGCPLFCHYSKRIRESMRFFKRIGKISPPKACLLK